LCIPCKIVRADESQRENSRRHRAELRGEAPVEELMLCKDCGEEVEPNPRTGKIDCRRLRCLECTEAHERDLKNDWKKNKSVEERAKAGHDCPGKKIVDGLVRPCGEWVVPEKSMKQKFCTTECWARTYTILHPERREYYRNYATRLRERAWRPADWEGWPVWQQAVGIKIIENPNLEPREIGILMDNSRTSFRCPEHWKHVSFERAFTTPGPGATWLSKIRTKIRKELVPEN
jgi:hypothetical protein